MDHLGVSNYNPPPVAGRGYNIPNKEAKPDKFSNRILNILP